MTFSRARLAGHRQGHGWSESELARRAGIRTATLVEYERGLRVPTPAVINGLADALDVPVTELDRSELLIWREEFVAALVQYLEPLSPEDVAAVSAILARSA